MKGDFSTGKFLCLVERLCELLQFLVVSSNAAGVRHSQLVNLRLFNGEGVKRNVFVRQGRMMFQHHQSKVGDFNVRNPVVIQPSKAVGDVFFVYCAVVLPVTLKLKSILLEQDTEMDKKIRTFKHKVLALKALHPFFNVSYEPKFKEYEAKELKMGAMDKQRINFRTKLKICKYLEPLLNLA